jgi:hypothetical protein
MNEKQEPEFRIQNPEEERRKSVNVALSLIF